MPRSHNAELDLFLNALFPWDANGEKLFKSVSWTFPLKPGEQPRPGMKPGQKPMANYAADTYERLVQLIEGRRSRPDTDLYICLGTQRLANVQKFTTDGFPKAVRRQDNIASYSSIWMDLDVKPGAYATTEEAYAALDAFIDAIDLPPASVEVLSGSGGVHVYWCVKEPMPPQTWLPLAKALRDSALAHGMHFDALVTVTPTALLRIPGSFNWKRPPPTQVQLLEDSSFALYDYAELATPLQAAAAVAGANIGTGTSGKTTYTQNFTANLNTSPPVTVDDVADACLVIRDILDRGGNGDPEPLWNHALLLASFTSNPSDAAHRLSKGDPRYSAPDTDKKLAEKEAAKAANPNIGWPQCDQFNALTQKCHACVFFHNHKSPLSYASKVQPINPQQTVRPNDDLMPPGFWRDINDHVLTFIKDKDGNEHIHDVLNHPIHTAGVDEMTGRLVFETASAGARKWCDMAVSQATQPAEAGRALAGDTVRIFIHPAAYTKARDFLVAWMDHLQKVKKTIAPAHYGWTDDLDGFTFDQTTYTASGEVLAYRGKTHDARFAQRGELKPWQEAMALVYGRPPLETIVASSFAAPLVALVANHSVIVSACSESGTGKTTGMSLAQAVWGNPRTGMSALNDTLNSTMKKISDLQSLPIYWDELRTTKQLEDVINLVFSVTQGKGKSRLTKTIEQADANSFTTMFCVASNYGIAETVYAQTDGTEAGGLRIFELLFSGSPSTISHWHAQQLQKRLELNYGCAGAEYAKYVAANRDACRQLHEAVAARYDAQLKFSAKERFWQVTMAALLAGAMLANRAGLTQFDIKAIDAYLVETLEDMRAQLVTKDYSTLTTSTSALGLMQELASELRGKHLVTTNVINYVGMMGRPTKIDIVDMTADMLTRMGDVWMQIGRNDGRIRLRVRPFHTWLQERRINPRQVKKLLEQDYVVTQSKQSIGAGIPTLDALSHVLGGRSECIDLTPRNPGSTPGAAST